MHILKRNLALAAVLTLIACGGGGGGGDALDDPADDDIVTPAPTPAPTPTPNPDADQEPDNGEFGPIEQLLGQSSFLWQFTGSDVVFRLIALYSADDIVISNGGLPVLVRVSDSLQASNDGVISDFNPLPMACAWDDANTIYLCLLAGPGEPAESWYVFSTLVNGLAAGNFELCEGSTDCLGDLDVQPDGVAELRVDNTIASTEAGRALHTGLDATPYLAYEKQGVPVTLLEDGTLSDGTVIDQGVIDSLRSAISR